MRCRLPEAANPDETLTLRLRGTPSPPILWLSQHHGVRVLVCMCVRVCVCACVCVCVCVQALSWQAPQLELNLFLTNVGRARVSGLTCKAAVPKYPDAPTPPPTRLLTRTHTLNALLERALH